MNFYNRNKRFNFNADFIAELHDKIESYEKANRIRLTSYSEFFNLLDNIKDIKSVSFFEVNILIGHVQWLQAYGGYETARQNPDKFIFTHEFQKVFEQSLKGDIK